MAEQRVVIVGGGFAGLNAARGLGRLPGVEVVLIDQRNHHLFQPLLYQVAMAGLSPAQIAKPIRSLLAEARNVRVVMDSVERVEPQQRCVVTASERYPYDYLVLAAGAQHAYFGNEQWEPHAPGLKTLSQATEIRRRVLTAFERAECESDGARRRALLTFIVVGGGPTGVELAGALGEMSRFTLARDFHAIDPKLARVILIEAGPRILPAFSQELTARATRDLESLGVQVWVGSPVSVVDAEGVQVGQERIAARTVLWAAGVKASFLGAQVGEVDRQGRVHVSADLSVPDHPEIFVLGDLAHFEQDERTLPGVAPVAMQQGRHVVRAIAASLRGKARPPFRYVDKGQVATIGRSRAIMELGAFKVGGLFAWLTWLVIHIYYLSGFENRLIVLLQWAWSYISFGRGARLIVPRAWRSFGGDLPPGPPSSGGQT